MTTWKPYKWYWMVSQSNLSPYNYWRKENEYVSCNAFCFDRSC